MSTLNTIPVLNSTLPACAQGVVGACYWTPDSGKGYVIYDEWENCYDSWMLVPGFSLLPTALLGAVYLLFLIYLLLGVSIVADTFMDGIMEICSSTRKVKRKDEFGNIVEVEEPVWNWVVANITLMALGTSAPEILLALVETTTNLGKPAGELGPSCIVGSSVYNLLGITAACCIALPAGQFKKIKEFRVFATTAIWSLWVHLWMLIVYKWWTPDKVTIVEAFLTFGQFPVFVTHAWIMDKQPWKRQVKDVSIAKIVPVGDEELAAGSSVQPGAHHGSLEERIQEQRQKFESYKYRRALVRVQAGLARQDSVNLQAAPKDGAGAPQTVQFKLGSYSFLESAGTAEVVVVRHGDLERSLTVKYYTKDGTAVAGLDYKHCEGTLEFAFGQSEKTINVPIIDDDLAEPDVIFYVVLELTGGSDAYLSQERVPVTIIDDDDNGVLTFASPTAVVPANNGRVVVKVARENGLDGSVLVDYCTKDGTAKADADYKPSKGTLIFEKGESVKLIEVQLSNVMEPQEHRSFRIVISNPQGGATLGRRTECRITVLGDKLATTWTPPKSTSSEKGEEGKEGGEEPFNLWKAWVRKVQDAIIPDPELEVAEGKKQFSWTTLVLHYINITWKLIFCIVPPAGWKQGYPCFIASLAMIVGVVYILEETAILFGCTVGLTDLMTGMSIVAMGTSLPDTFASVISALKDDTADSAVGNITGSNTVNVLLGLGLPWVIASCYYKAQGQDYYTPAGALSFTLIIFACVATAGFGLMMFRRSQGGELGGGVLGKSLYSAALLSLWMLFLVLSGLYEYGHISKI